MSDISVLLLLLAAGVVLAGARDSHWRWLLLPLPLLLAWLPLAGSSGWLWLEGLLGDLSITTLLLLASFISRRLLDQPLFDRREAIALYGLLLVAGLILYPATLGLTQGDPYRFGFTTALPLLLLLLAALFWYCRLTATALLLCSIVLAGEGGLLSSRNSWDYLLDPLVWLAAPVMLMLNYRRNGPPAAVADQFQASGKSGRVDIG
jgi:hypothetical protein